MAYADEMRRLIAVKVVGRSSNITAGAAVEVLRSWKTGSEVTGSLGVPVDEGNLRNSIQLEQESPDAYLVSTNVDYAPEIEYNDRGATLRSEVGQFHAREVTIAGFPRIVEHVARTLGPSNA